MSRSLSGTPCLPRSNDSATSPGSGVGLGLAVARGLADAVDATIEVDDTPGGGLTMIVTVPVAESPEPHHLEPVEPVVPFESRVGG